MARSSNRRSAWPSVAVSASTSTPRFGVLTSVTYVPSDLKIDLQPGDPTKTRATLLFGTARATLYVLPVTLVMASAVGLGARGATTTSLLTTVTLLLALPYPMVDEGAAVNLYAGIELASLSLFLIALTIAASFCSGTF